MNFRKKTLLVLAVAVLASGCANITSVRHAEQSKAKDTFTRIRRVAVFPFENYTDAKDADKSVDTLLAPALREEEIFDDVEDLRFTRDTMRKLKMTATDILDREAVKKLGDEMNVQGILYGKIVGWSKKDKGLPPQITMDLVLVEPSTARVLWTGNVSARGSLTFDEVLGWGPGNYEVDVARIAVRKLTRGLANDVRDIRQGEKKGIVAQLRTEQDQERKRLEDLKAQTGKTQAEIDKAKAEAKGIRDAAASDAVKVKSELDLEKAALDAEKTKTQAQQQEIDQEKLKVEVERKKIAEDLKKIEDEKKALEAAKKAAEAPKEAPPAPSPTVPAEAPKEAPPAPSPPVPAEGPKQ
ncbi:MAG TPA: hypothetical protein VN450_04995 [Candidatus Methylomirabilis sp.]|nr:hypothetical protein [Candidatus Methylomirabilis sp.]